MFHKTKKLLQTFIRRARGLIRYIYDYKILLFSLAYISISFFTPLILRNIDSQNPIGYSLAVSLAFLLVLITLVVLRNIRIRRNRNLMSGTPSKLCVHNLYIPLTLVLVMFLASLRTASSCARARDIAGEVASFTNRPVTFEAYIHEEVEEKQQHNYLTVVILQDLLFEDQTLEKDHGFLLIKVPNFYKFNIGQVCNFYGVLVEPENFDDFDYKKYLNNKNIFLIMEDPNFYCFDIDKRRGGNILKNRLIDIKDNLTQETDKKLHEPYSTLLLGILFGKKRPIEKELQENIRMSGVSHIISASGYNITVVIIITDRLLIFLPKKIRIILTLLTIWLFTLFAGFSSSITRACIMNSLFLLAVLLGRHNSKHIAIPFVATIFILIKPMVIYDIGFLMSLSATLGLNYILPVLKKIFKHKKGGDRYIDKYILPTTSCTLSTLPVTIFTFKTFTIWSVVSNGLILPVLENSIFVGLTALILSKVHPPLSNFFYTVITLQLKYFELIVSKIGQLGFGVWEVSSKPATLLAISTSILILIFTIYLYPVENEKYNFYLQDN